MLVSALIAGVLVVLLVGYFLLARGGDGTASRPAPASQAAPPVSRIAAAPAPPEPASAPPLTDAQFTEDATVDAPTGSAELRSGPAAGAFVIARLDRGTLIATFQQTGDWWQVRAPNGAVGYLARNQIRLMEGAAAQAPRPAQVARQPEG
jgi:hypothetical protein